MDPDRYGRLGRDRHDAPPSAREGLKSLNVLIGEWKGTGQPEGSLRKSKPGSGPKA